MAIHSNAKTAQSRHMTLGAAGQNNAACNMLSPPLPGPAIVARLFDIIAEQQAMNVLLDDLRAKISGDPSPGQSDERASLPPQSIESLLAHIEGIGADNKARVNDLIARF
jgi:hypothetical protein